MIFELTKRPFLGPGSGPTAFHNARVLVRSQGADGNPPRNLVLHGPKENDVPSGPLSRHSRYYSCDTPLQRDTLHRTA